MKTLKDKIMSDIYDERITPRPRWQFIALHILLWSICIVTLLVGILAVSFVFFEIHTPERLYMNFMGDKPMMILRILPFIWGIGAIIALIVAYYLFSRTGRGYRYSIVTLLSILVFGSLIGGWVLYETRVPHFGERQMQRFGPGYRNLREGIMREAPKPENGYLPLQVMSHENSIWIGKSIDGMEWKVTLTCRTPACEENATEIPEQGPPILFVGEISQKGEFAAHDLRLPPRNRDEREKIKEEFLKNIPLIQHR